MPYSDKCWRVWVEHLAACFSYTISTSNELLQNIAFQTTIIKIRFVCIVKFKTACINCCVSFNARWMNLLMYNNLGLQDYVSLIPYSERCSRVWFEQLAASLSDTISSSNELQENIAFQKTIIKMRFVCIVKVKTGCIMCWVSFNARWMNSIMNNNRGLQD